MNPLKRLFWPEYMVKKHHVQGGLPSAREAYGTCLKMAWPSALESVLVALVSSVDTMMVGQLDRPRYPRWALRPSQSLYFWP